MGRLALVISTCLSIALGLAAVFPEPAACGVVILNDPLSTGTSGTRIGGEFPGGGWRVLDTFDAIYWHLPYPVSNGAVQFSVRGLRPGEGSGQMADKTELFHMYDYTQGDADNYYGGYRENYYKHFVRKSGTLNGVKTDSLELLLKIGENYLEPDTAVLSWDPARTYVFRETWQPDGVGGTVFRLYRDGDLLYTMSRPYSYLPAGHSVRIGASTRRLDGTSAPIGAVFSDVTVEDNSAVPAAPDILAPAAGQIVNTTAPLVSWRGDDNTRYRIRVNTTGDPDSGIVWDSGDVTSVRRHANTGPLANGSSYHLFVRIGNGIGWGPWSAGVDFTVNTSHQPLPGMVRVEGCTFADDNGSFLALGATYMSALRHCRNDRHLFLDNLAFLKSRGFDYVRILSMVGWSSREIAPVSFTNSDDVEVGQWSDYWQQFRDMVDIIYNCGMRTEITIFADAQHVMPGDTARYSHMDSVLANLAGREHKVLLLEVANEGWQNGFPEPGGVEKLRVFGSYLAARTSIPVALSSPYDTSDSGIEQMYSGSAADIATVHFDRNIGTYEGGWLPVRDCYRVPALYPGVPPASSNEPIGPGASVNTEDDPIKLVSAACFAWAAKLPTYVFHSSAGVYAQVRFESMAGVNDFRFVKGILPADLPNWTRNDGIQAGAPFTAFCGTQSNKYWTEVSGATSGCHRNIGATRSRQFVCYPQGLLSGGLRLQARKDLECTVYNPLTGSVVAATSLTAGQDLVLPQGPGAYIVRGTLTGVDSTPPGPVVLLSANPADGSNVLTWTNPTDDDFLGTRIVCRTDRFPASASDGELVCDRSAAPGSRDLCTHSGLTNGVRYYYAAFAYDDYSPPNHAPAATVVAMPVAGQCFSESFTYADGALSGNRQWSGSGQVQVLAESVRITGGSDNHTVSHTVSCSGTLIRAHARVKAGSGSSTLWGFWLDDAAGHNLARWYGSGTSARPRIGATGLVLDPVTLTGGWDALEVRIDTVANTSHFYFNGSYLGSLSHSSTGAGDAVGSVALERVYGGQASDSVSLDSVVIGPVALDAVPPGPVTSLTAVSAESQVDLTWTNPIDADFAGVRIIYKTTGFPEHWWDGTPVYDGAGTACVHTSPPAGIVYYAAYAYDALMNFSAPATAVATLGGSDCFADEFDYADGSLNGSGGWSGSASGQVAVEDGCVKLTGGAGSYDSLHPLTCSGSPLGVRIRVRKGSGTAAIWNLYVDDSSGTNLARWYGTGSSLRGRIGSGTPTAVATLTGGWDEAYLKIDLAANKTTFAFNGAVLATLTHAAGDSIGWIRIERSDSSSAVGQHVYLDGIRVGPADVIAPDASFGSPSATITRAGPVAYQVSFSEPVYGLGPADIGLTGAGAADAQVSVSGSGAGPYSISLSSFTGVTGGLVGIGIAAGACVDCAGNANTAAAASEEFLILANDGSIAQAKQMAEGAAVGLGNKALYLKRPECGYVLEPDRCAGIRIEGEMPAAEGDSVCLAGTVHILPGGERYIAVERMHSAGLLPLRPLGMSAAALASDLAAGLFARIWGIVKVDSAADDFYVLTLADGSEVTVFTRGPSDVKGGDFRAISGALSIGAARAIYEL